MIGKTLNYISHHAIAILALVCSLLALAGASYAATQLPKNSVGNAQIKQGAVSPPKFSKADRRLRAAVREGHPGRQDHLRHTRSQGHTVGAEQYWHHLASISWPDQAASTKACAALATAGSPAPGADLGDGIRRRAPPVPLSKSCRRTLIRW